MTRAAVGAAIAFWAVCVAAPVGAQATGTLHRATMAQWVRATPENKLATASDWAASQDCRLNGNRRGCRRYRNSDEVRRHAADLVACVDASYTTSAARMEAAEVAAGCMVLMGN